MTTDMIQAISSVVQAIAVIISLIYVSRQIRDAAMAVKGQTYQSITSAYAEIEARISQDNGTAIIYDKGCQNPEKLDQIEEIRCEQIMCSKFNFFKNLYYQNKNGLLIVKTFVNM